MMEIDKSKLTSFETMQSAAIGILQKEATASSTECQVGDESWNINNWGDFYDASFDNKHP